MKEVEFKWHIGYCLLAPNVFLNDTLMFSGLVFLLRPWKMPWAPSPASPQTNCYRVLSAMWWRGCPAPLCFMWLGKSTPSCSHLRENCTTTASFRGTTVNLNSTEIGIVFLSSLWHSFTPLFPLYTPAPRRKAPRRSTWRERTRPTPTRSRSLNWNYKR